MSSPVVPVVVALILNENNELLISQRPSQKSYSGYWEFPGGKIEAGEAPYPALVRELKEELDLEICAAHPWKTLEYVYPEKTVELNLWLVTSFTGAPRSMEEQAFRWLPLDQLNTIDFLPANKLILTELGSSILNLLFRRAQD